MLQKKTSKVLNRMIKEIFDSFDQMFEFDTTQNAEQMWFSFSNDHDIGDYLEKLGFHDQYNWSFDFEGNNSFSSLADPFKILKWARKMYEKKNDLVIIESEENLIFEGTISEAKKKLQPVHEFFERRKKLRAFK